MSGGSCGAAAAIAACTSCPAASMLRSSENWIVIWVSPCALVDVMESTPAIVENCFSSGVATADAIVSGLAPGSEAVTWMVGKSTFGRSFTGSARYASMPNTTMPAMSSVVMTGRRMKSSVFIEWESLRSSSSLWERGRGLRRRRRRLRWLDLDSHARRETELPIRDHTPAGGHALDDHAVLSL